MASASFLSALLALPKLYYPKVSRDGTKVAWTWAQTGPAADVFYNTTVGSGPPIQLTRTPQDSWLISWTPDSQAVIISQDRDGDERYQLFRVALERPLKLEPLTEPEPNFFIRGGQIHPNHHWLIYAANYDAEKGEEIDATWIYRHDLKTGERRPLAKPKNPAYFVPDLNASGTHILYARKDLHPTGRQIWLVDVHGKEDREILNFGSQVKVFASWFPDGKRVLFLVESATYRKLGLYQLETNSLTWLIDDRQRNIEHAFVPPNDERVVVVEVRQAKARSSILDIGNGSETQVRLNSKNAIPLAPAREDQWVTRVYSSSQPDDLQLIHPSQLPVDSAPSLARVWDRISFQASDLAAAEVFRWSARDGLEIQGWLYRPSDPAKGTIVIVHGGPTHHSQDKVYVQIQFLVSQGFNVLDPNYRGSTGFGLPFQEAIKVHGWGGMEQEDIIAGIRALIEAKIAIPGKIGVTGTSYGGYSAWFAVTRNPVDVIAAAAPICGMTDLIVDYETTRPDLRPLSEEMIGGNPDQVPERYHERSPINFVGNIAAKLLIVQGMQDPNVTPENLREIRKSLDKANIEYDLLIFDDEGHGIFRPKNLKILYPRLAAFFESAFSS